MKVNEDKRVEPDEILVFKTSLATPAEVHMLEEILGRTKGVEEWSVDFEDWEKVLRIISGGITAPEVIDLLQKAGIKSKVLEP